MHEIVLNVHMHTRYSDGAGTHADIARAALGAGLDAVVITDHNVLVEGYKGYFRVGSRKVLLLPGEEIHDRSRVPQKDHLLVLGAEEELASLAANPSAVIDAARRGGGLTFLAHIHDPAAPSFAEPNISWENWSVEKYDGIELWNGFSELKSHLPTRLHGIFYAFFPAFLAHAPAAAAVEKWDQLLAEQPVVAIGGSDAHALPMRLGPLRRTVFEYAYHFAAINTHVLLPAPLTGEAEEDGRRIFAALSAGHCFIGYDMPGSTRGFRFTGKGPEAGGVMGDELRGPGVTLQAYLPSFGELRLLRNGTVIRHVRHTQALTFLALEPGVYRVEAYCRFLGRRRAWIFSNPIYVR
ncbi:MAG: CehA/McbA family metallohydrolase [Anaerolineales bacterium]